ncbi:MAG: alpha/beta hydrolase [Bdellovibrio sp. ArHS]|uniref:alpha/beta fold hydrolase n=1 Tax=Bdellovibrio sp. ArHS TaxID=1569284 RepID=UPI000583FF6C|nr:alpha/beta hydrolase [Bdellovibrio sp. ArHS]KHD88190.1 MAG: alpha/beta hydrolase [Bdellovibrio sp. ArHS]
MAQNRNWILLRGLARGVGHWGSFVEKMRTRFPNDNIELLDLPGNGTRHKEKSPLKIADYVKDLRAHSQFVKNGETFNILSVSLGAMITVEWMREFPHEVKKSYLFCTSSSAHSPFYHRFYPMNFLRASRLLTATGDEALWEKTILEMVTNSHERREAEILSLMAFTKNNPMSMENVFRQLVAASKYQFPKEVPGEVSLFGSHGDRLVSPQCTLRIGETWGLKPTMHPWAGHDIPIDDPHWVLEHLL